jgi:hypothetical protein
MSPQEIVQKINSAINEANSYMQQGLVREAIDILKTITDDDEIISALYDIESEQYIEEKYDHEMLEEYSTDYYEDEILQQQELEDFEHTDEYYGYDDSWYEMD